MERLAGGCCVIEPHEGEWRIEGTWRFRTPISSRMGAKLLAQTENRFARGLSPGRVNPGSEEVHYVVSGLGQCFVDGFNYPLEPGSAVFVPKGAELAVESSGDSEMIVVSVACPEEKEPRFPLVPRTVPLTSYRAPERVVLEREREEVTIGSWRGASPPSGDGDPTPVALSSGLTARPTGSGLSNDRTFRVLVDKDLGCEQVTQFVGWIPPSKRLTTTTRTRRRFTSSRARA